MKTIKLLTLCAAMLALTGAAHAVTVASYDVTGAQGSGFGGWAHAYDGSIAADGSGTYTYSGGSGTLNDGVVPTNEGAAQLFALENNATITLHLSELSQLSAITIFGGTLPNNSIPGTLSGWSVTIGATTMAFSSTDFGPGCESGLCSDSVSLVGSGLDLLATDTVTLSSFSGGWSGYYDIGEVTVNGNLAAAVPEPETYALMLAGLGAMGAVVRRRRALR